MLLALVGLVCSGKSSVAEYLVERHGFTQVTLGHRAQEGASLHFTSADVMLQHVTAHWQTNYVTLDLDTSELISMFEKRPFFLLVGIDAPIMQRWARAKARYVSFLTQCARPGRPRSFCRERRPDSVRNGRGPRYHIVGRRRPRHLARLGRVEPLAAAAERRAGLGVGPVELVCARCAPLAQPAADHQHVYPHYAAVRAPRLARAPVDAQAAPDVGHLLCVAVFAGLVALQLHEAPRGRGDCAQEPRALDRLQRHAAWADQLQRRRLCAVQRERAVRQQPGRVPVPARRGKRVAGTGPRPGRRRGNDYLLQHVRRATYAAVRACGVPSRLYRRV